MENEQEIKIGDEVAVNKYFHNDYIEQTGYVTGITDNMIGITSRTLFFRTETWYPKTRVSVIQRT